MFLGWIVEKGSSPQSMLVFLWFLPRLDTTGSRSSGTVLRTMTPARCTKGAARFLLRAKAK